MNGTEVAAVIKDARACVQGIKTKKASVDGQMEQIGNQLKRLGCQSIEEAEQRLVAIQREIATNEQEIQGLALKANELVQKIKSFAA